MQEEGQGTLGNGKTLDSGRRVSGKRRGFGDQERGEKGDERVRGASCQGAVRGATQKRASLKQQTWYFSRYQKEAGDLGHGRKTQKEEKTAQKRGSSGHSQQNYFPALLAGNSKTLLAPGDKALQNGKG